MKAILIATLASAILVSNASAASYSHWRKSIDAAKEARKKRDFDGARKILTDEAAEAAQLGHQSEAENSVLIAETYYDEGRFEVAFGALEDAIAKIGDDKRSKPMQIWRGFALALKAQTLLPLGRTDEATAAAVEARTVLQEKLGAYNSQLYILNMILGNIYFEKKNYPEAEKAYVAALKQAESPNFVTRPTWSGAEERVRMFRVKRNEEGPLRINAYLGDICLEEGKLKEAGDYYKASLKLAESAYGKKSVATIIPLEGQARLELKEGRRADYEKDLDRIFDAATREQGLELWTTNPFWAGFDDSMKKGDDAAATQFAGKIARIFAAQNFDPKLLSVRALNLAGRENPDWNRVEKSAALFRAAAAAAYPAEPYKAGPMIAGFASYADLANQPKIARENFETLAKNQENAPDKSMLIGALGKLADYAVADNKPADALPLLHRVSELIQQKYGNDTRTADAFDKEAALLKQLGQTDAATALQTKATEVRKNAFLKR